MLQITQTGHPKALRMDKMSKFNTRQKSEKNEMCTK